MAPRECAVSRSASATTAAVAVLGAVVAAAVTTEAAEAAEAAGNSRLSVFELGRRSSSDGSGPADAGTAAGFVESTSTIPPAASRPTRCSHVVAAAAAAAEAAEEPASR
jgi:hypothetical protein